MKNIFKFAFISLLFTILVGCNKTTSYTITFDSNGGTNVEPIIVTNKEKLVLPDEPTKEGYIFNGWLLNGDTFDETLIIDKNLTLTADWKSEKVKTYKVIFEYGNGTKNLEINIEENSKVSKPDDPIKDEYDFLGWYLNDEQYNFDTLVSCDTKLVAKWKKKSSGTSSESTNNTTNKPSSNDNTNGGNSTNSTTNSSTNNVYLSTDGVDPEVVEKNMDKYNVSKVSKMDAYVSAKCDDGYQSTIADGKYYCEDTISIKPTIKYYCSSGEDVTEDNKCKFTIAAWKEKICINGSVERNNICMTSYDTTYEAHEKCPDGYDLYFDKCRKSEEIYHEDENYTSYEYVYTDVIYFCYSSEKEIQKDGKLYCSKTYYTWDYDTLDYYTSYKYSCPNGGTVVGENCVGYSDALTEYICPTGYRYISFEQCYPTSDRRYENENVTYYCSDGWILKDKTCYHYLFR